MARVAFTARALSDLDRIFDFLAQYDPIVARQAAEAIVEATGVLGRHPMIGRALRGAVRELVISRGRTGYVALYRFVSDQDRVEVLAIRHQREAGFA